MPTPEIIARNTMWWSNEVDRLQAIIDSLQNDINTYNQVIASLKQGEYMLEQIQTMENGGIRILPPKPHEMVNIEEVSQNTAPLEKNGKAVSARE
jgi:prefoldin subunit 5